MKRLIVGLAVVVLAATTAHAEVVMNPPFDTGAAGLGPGDPYHLAFVTEGVHNAMDPTIDFYNDFVRAEAGLPVAITEHYMFDWYAIASTLGTDARANAVVGNGVPVYLLDGTRIANGFIDMWDGSLIAPIGLTQYGGSPGDVKVWTGSSDDGFRWPDYTLNGTYFRAVQGDASQGPAGGHMALTMSTIDTPLRFYALSEELQTTPEPSTAVLLTMGALTLTIGWWRRRRAA